MAKPVTEYSDWCYRWSGVLVLFSFLHSSYNTHTQTHMGEKRAPTATLSVVQEFRLQVLVAFVWTQFKFDRKDVCYQNGWNFTPQAIVCYAVMVVVAVGDSKQQQQKNRSNSIPHRRRQSPSNKQKKTLANRNWSLLYRMFTLCKLVCLEGRAIFFLLAPLSSAFERV